MHKAYGVAEGWRAIACVRFAGKGKRSRASKHGKCKVAFRRVSIPGIFVRASKLCWAPRYIICTVYSLQPYIQ